MSFWIVVIGWAAIWVFIAWKMEHETTNNYGPADRLANGFTVGLTIIVMTGLCSLGTFWLLSWVVGP